MTDVFVAPAQSLQGEVRLPGDKSISHRAALLAALGTRPVHVENLAVAGDVDSTVAAVEALGAQVIRHEHDPSHVCITGRGMRGLQVDGVTIDAGNAGTLARLLPGILVGQAGTATIVGDASLGGRPMGRIADPLGAMGAKIELAAGGTLPMIVTGGGELAGIEYDLPVASAQVQSALLLAGLFADGPTTVREPARLRDHTERMLRLAGVRVARTADGAVTVHPAESVELPDLVVPADPSAAAPLIVAASVLDGSLLRLPELLLNPGRSGLLAVLARMGSRHSIERRHDVGGEPVGDVEIVASPLQRASITVAEMPTMIDEVPVLALLAQFLRGETLLKGLSELRVKETDRIHAVVLALRGIGVAIDEHSGDGLSIRGSGTRPDGGTIDAGGDHRIAMLGGIAGLVSRKGVTIIGAECVDISFPGFFDVLEALATR